MKQIKENQNRINFLKSFHEEMRSNKQSETIARAASEILQIRIAECTQNFNKILQKRSEVSIDNRNFNIKNYVFFGCGGVIFLGDGGGGG